MIGIKVKNRDKRAVFELFELFKTPWEFYSPQKLYSTVLSNCSKEIYGNTKQIIYFNFNEKDNISDTENFNAPRIIEPILETKSGLFPVYGNICPILSKGEVLITIKNTGESAGIETCEKGKQILKIGYDLFEEIKFLLKNGQPEKLALHPTLDIHIQNLRYWIIRSGQALMEIPPAPVGKRFFVCLSHDVDFVGIKKHKFDHTIIGFIFRAVFGSVFRTIKGNLPFKNLLKNWCSVISLPLVYLGLMKDFWFQFERYLELEDGVASTFFFVPFKNEPGKDLEGKAPGKRSVKYNINDIEAHLRGLVAKGCEIGVHGIDSWIDINRGIKEKKQIEHYTDLRDLGIRMHWLYFNQDSPVKLEKAGYLYDSSVGYNNAVGYKAGTLQPFHFLQAMNLVEVPMHIMDTALFYSGRMNLSTSKASNLVQKIIEDAMLFGGALSINWHHRSIAPERMWGDFYKEILKKLKKSNAKFVTKSQAVNWFERRRSISFKECKINRYKIQVRLDREKKQSLDDFVLRVYLPVDMKADKKVAKMKQPRVVDYPIKNQSELLITL